MLSQGLRFSPPKEHYESSLILPKRENIREWSSAGKQRRSIHGWKQPWPHLKNWG